MQCRNHPDQKAEHICVGCNAAICSECAEEIKPGAFACFQCAMLQSVSEIGADLTDKHIKAAEKKKRRKKKWGPFNYFLVVSSTLIVVMWGVILFGGQPVPSEATGFEKSGRILLFMADSALKRHAKFESQMYPRVLLELIPQYLALREPEIDGLDQLSYETDQAVGYRLSIIDPDEDSLKIVLTAKGIENVSTPPKVTE